MPFQTDVFSLVPEVSLCRPDSLSPVATDEIQTRRTDGTENDGNYPWAVAGSHQNKDGKRGGGGRA